MQMKARFSFKADRYRIARGGYSRRLDISCRRCGRLVLVYQKDGPGNLRRLYLDRILAPKELCAVQKKSITRAASLKCPRCKEVLGIPYLYPKERRRAFRLFVDAVVKKTVKLN